MNVTVICISGKALNGKDTTAGFLKEYLESKNYKVLIMHYADLLKFICAKYFDWNGEKDDAGRTLLQRVGTDIVRNRRPNYWVDFVIEFIGVFYSNWDFIIIPDTRFPNEIDRPKEAGLDVIHIRVTRPNFKSPLTEEQQNHPSEHALDHVVPNICLINSGTLEQLKEYVCEIGSRIVRYATTKVLNKETDR